MIILDKLKGDDMYFNIDVKEQELKKVIEDAEEIQSELNFTSDIIVKDIEEKINAFNQLYKHAARSLEQLNAKPAAVEPQAPVQPVPQPVQQPIQQTAPHIERTVVPVKFKPVTAVNTNKTVQNEEQVKSKQQMIFELAEQGVSIVDIAKRLNVGQGEVTLILSLKNEEN
jgi:DNA-binding NarL/FixJ family response regulator